MANKNNLVYQENRKKPIVELEDSVTEDWYENGEKYFGRRVRDHGFLGTWSKTQEGYGFKIRIYCDKCKKRWIVAFLYQSAAGWCYIYNYKGKFLADLRDQVLICGDCEVKK